MLRYRSRSDPDFYRSIMRIIREPASEIMLITASESEAIAACETEMRVIYVERPEIDESGFEINQYDLQVNRKAQEFEDKYRRTVSPHVHLPPEQSEPAGPKIPHDKIPHDNTPSPAQSGSNSQPNVPAKIEKKSDQDKPSSSHSSIRFTYYYPSSDVKNSLARKLSKSLLCKRKPDFHRVSCLKDIIFVPNPKQACC